MLNDYFIKFCIFHSHLTNPAPGIRHISPERQNARTPNSKFQDKKFYKIGTWSMSRPLLDIRLPGLGSVAGGDAWMTGASVKDFINILGL
jgi:hypothetical protein